MASNKQSCSFDVEIDDQSDSPSGRSSVKVSFKDANGRDNEVTQPVDSVNNSSVSAAIGKALGQLGQQGISFVDLKDDESGAHAEQKPDGFQGDVPDEQKPKKDDDGKDKGGDKDKDDSKSEKKPEPAPAKPAAGDKPAPAPAKK